MIAQTQEHHIREEEVYGCPEGWFNLSNNMLFPGKAYQVRYLTFSIPVPKVISNCSAKK